MGGNTWPSNTTRHTRYCETGIGNDPIISKYAVLYSMFRPKKRLRILDVGCSTGSAARHLKGYLTEFGVSCTVDGMDVSEKVMSAAESNLDKFYLGNLFDIAVEPVYDIAICSRLLRFFAPPEQCKGVSRCASFCNDDGVVITDGIPGSRYAISENVMLPRAVLLDEVARHTQDWESKSEFCKYWTRCRTCLGILYRSLLSRSTPRCISNDRKKWPDCPYCWGL